MQLFGAPKPYQELTCISITRWTNDIKIALFTVLQIIQTYKCYRVHNIFLAFRYEYMRKNPATAPTTIPPVVAQKTHCSKTNLLSTMDSADTWHRTRKKRPRVQGYTAFVSRYDLRFMPNIPTNKAPGVSLIVVRFSNHRKISHSIYIGSTTTRKIRNGCTSAGALTSTTEIRPHHRWVRFFHKRLTMNSRKLSKYSGTAKELTLSRQREQRTRAIVLVPRQLTGKPDEIVLVR